MELGEISAVLPGGAASSLSPPPLLMADATPVPVTVAVIGSRSFHDYDRLAAVLDRLAQTVPIAGISSGGARGADELARRYAQERGLALQEFLPGYPRYGRRAPLVRNRAVIEAAGLVVAFWDGFSAGTGHALKLARKLGLNTIVVVPPQHLAG